MADMDVDAPPVEQDEDAEDVEEAEGEEVGEADEAVKWVEDEELYPPSGKVPDNVWLLKVPNDLFERLAAIPVGDEERTVANLRYYKGSSPSLDKFEIVIPTENLPEQPIASSSKTPAGSTPPTHPEDSEIVYALEPQKDEGKSARWVYTEDERRFRWSGKSTERARPTLLAKVTQTHVLKRKMSQAASTRVLKAAMLRDQEKKRRTRMLDDTDLTEAERNILAGGGQLESGVVRKATEKPSEKKPVKEKAYRILSQSLQDILYEEFNRYKYWKMDTLEKRLQQPQHWIRQNLKAIAVREEAGPYKDYWRLQDKFIEAQGEAEDVGLAPENQEQSDAVKLAIKRDEVDSVVDEADDAADTDTESKPKIEQSAQGSGSRSQPEEVELSDDEDDDEDSEMDEVDA